jgi:hypothetical protein
VVLLVLVLVLVLLLLLLLLLDVFEEVVEHLLRDHPTFRNHGVASQSGVHGLCERRGAPAVPVEQH